MRDGPVIEALSAPAEQNPRWGFWKLFDRLHNLGPPWNPKRVYRVYCALRLNRARRTKRRIPRRPKVPLVAPPTLNQTWALDFMRDTLYDGRVFRTLNVLDQGHREGLAFEIGFSLPSRRVIALLDELVALHGAPAALRITGRSFWRSASRPGPSSRASTSPSSSRGSRRRTPSSSAATRPTARRSWMRTSSRRSPKFGRSRRTGCDATTPSGPMTASAGCRRSRFCRGQPAPRSTTFRCLRDGGAFPSSSARR